jgi:hypothetical protein
MQELEIMKQHYDIRNLKQDPQICAKDEDPGIFTGKDDTELRKGDPGM